jgi:DNA-binding response OmpR family regulator
MKVLLIEHEAAEAEPLRQALHAVAPAEFEVTVADSLSAALDHARGAAFDVALLALPCPSEPEAVRRMIEAAPDLPLVALVGPDDEVLGEHAVAMGARDFLVKRSKRRTLAARVLRKATEIARLEHDRAALTHALADARARLGAVLHAGSVGVAFTSLDGRFEDLNFALEAMLGYSRSARSTSTSSGGSGGAMARSRPRSPPSR